MLGIKVMISEAAFQVGTFAASESVTSLDGAKQMTRGPDFSALVLRYSTCLFEYKFSPA